MNRMRLILSEDEVSPKVDCGVSQWVRDGLGPGEVSVNTRGESQANDGLIVLPLKGELPQGHQSEGHGSKDQYQPNCEATRMCCSERQ